MRWRSMDAAYITSSTIASTRGTDSATTMPVRQPSERKLTTSTMTSASANVRTKSETESSTMWGWSAIWVTSIPTGSSATTAFIARLRFLPERDDVGAVLHGDAEPKRGLAPLADHEGRRILVAALDRRDVAEPEDLPVGLDRHGRDRGGAGERTGHPHIDAVGRGVDRAAGDHRVLLGHAVEDLLGRDPEGGELGVVELDEDLLRPHADDVDLVDVRNPQQPLADILGARLELGEASGRRR